MRELPFTMEEVLDISYPEWRSWRRTSDIFNIACPYCDKGSNKRRLNVNLRKQVWRCPKCNNSGNAVHYYHFMHMGSSEIGDKAEYGKCVREIEDILHGTSEAAKTAQSFKSNKTKSEMLPVSEILPDDILDKVYREILAQPELALSEEHKQKLLDRGLDEQTIVRNQYRTVPSFTALRKLIPQTSIDTFIEKGFNKAKMTVPTLKYQSNLSLILGMSIASRLRKKKLPVYGVPGFFEFGTEKEKYPCLFLAQTGILIPTRNLIGQIVGMQIRTDSGNIRYLTVSSKAFAKGVVEKISRPHWVLDNDPLEVYEDFQRPEIILTEGPLKADVATYLMRKHGYKGYIAFVAIPGVNTTAMFYEDCKVLKRLGYDSITLAFDMDKCTNPNVMRGSKKLKGELQNLGFQVKDLMWDSDTASKLLKKEAMLVQGNMLGMPDVMPKNVFYAVATLSKILRAANIKDDRYQWSPKTKGIDDYLLHAEKLDLTH